MTAKEARDKATRRNREEGARSIRKRWPGSDPFWIEVQMLSGSWTVEQRRDRPTWRERLSDVLQYFVGGS